jgi:hypothetical protein
MEDGPKERDALSRRPAAGGVLPAAIRCKNLAPLSHTTGTARGRPFPISGWSSRLRATTGRLDGQPTLRNGPHSFGRKGLEDVTVDEVILRALEGGLPVTVDDVTKRFMVRVRGVVVREGKGGAHREFKCTLIRPDRVAKAIGEKGGGLARASKREKNMTRRRNASV